MSLAVDNPCRDFASEGDLGLRIGAIFAILGVSTIGVLIPLFSYRSRFSTTYFFIRAFASGVVITTGYVHVLGDAASILTDPCLGLSTDFPWAFVFATFATLLTFCLEYFLQRYFRARLGLPQIAGGVGHAHAEDNIPPPPGVQVTNGVVAKHQDGDVEVASNYAQEIAIEKWEAAVRLEAKATAYTLEAGIIFHSIFIGVTLGSTTGVETIRSLMIALMFHQGNEGVALGVTYVKAGFSTVKYLLLGLAFVMVTPIGIAIGIAVGTGYNRESKTALGFEGGFDSLSAGILVYNGLVDLIIPTFSDRDMPQQWWMQALGFGSLFTGAGVMSLIAKWA